jgi:hypothetical protein
MKFIDGLTGYGLCYMNYPEPDKKIPSVILGGGSLCITSTFNTKTQIGGVVFHKPRQPNDLVNGESVIGAGNEGFSELDSGFQILADDPNILTSLINSLSEARDQLASAQDKAKLTYSLDMELIHMKHVVPHD